MIYHSDMKKLLFAAIVAAVFASCDDEPTNYGFDAIKPETAISERTTAQPAVYMRLTNQQQANGITCYDAEFKAYEKGTRLTGMNVRIWLQAYQLGWAGMDQFAPGYAASPPNPAGVFTGSASSGPAIFGFQGPARYVNGAIDLVNPNSKVILDDWTKLFRVKFVGAPACPIVILDKETDPAAGGFYINDGITMSCDKLDGKDFGVTEYCAYIGWEQTSTKMPFGKVLPCGN